ncbi:response regulator transcription factor [Eubacterium barkeri]|uniref:Stage 0 sporulation protein A homolog n=1 Tax=Eubacterium barkeri TaxID=1528 RepID=A0A1H3CWM6_EUBBA|nr:response regulator transcription factor [Eubacterium barkeri]SDX58551.1 DNA-binding response regulator, OmpR family, contains REC and winged-helix (wHTH) domain [Eubacterium barkeri]
MYRILVVEDDDSIAASIATHLSSWGYSTRCATCFSAVLEDFKAWDPHLVLLDITLPFFNGYHWCQEIRKISRVPIIFLSSTSDDMNIVMAMNMGADDFITKPFELTVLTAKIAALLRRSYDFIGESSDRLSVQGAVLSTKEITLSYQDARLELTKNEYRILQVLMEHPGEVISRDQLMEKLWETDLYIDDNTLTVNVTRLRKRLAEIGLTNFITTKRGLGYLVE